MPSRPADIAARLAVERLDVLEELPRRCNVRGCRSIARVHGGGVFSERHLCLRHRDLYREHDRILSRIRDIVRA